MTWWFSDLCQWIWIHTSYIYAKAFLAKWFFPSLFWFVWLPGLLLLQSQVLEVVLKFQVNILKNNNDKLIWCFSGISNFAKTRYLGSWYEYANVFEFYQIGGTCVRATYTDEGDRIGVFNEGVNTMWVLWKAKELIPMKR